ncbi:MAG: antitoxin component YwqK of YwqJK toxin-antitoxin module [Planctomycetota bacterium]
MPDIFRANDPDRPMRGLHRGKPGIAERFERDQDTDEVLRSWSLWLVPGERAVRTGEENLFYPGGKRRAERHWDKGAKVGTWQSWFDNGERESEIEFAGDGVEAKMRWFHRNAALAAQGSGIQGVRTGEWSYWHANGQLRQMGKFIAGLKEGPWSFWSESGKLEARGTYLADRRVGDWLLAGRDEMPVD